MTEPYPPDFSVVTMLTSKRVFNQLISIRHLLMIWSSWFWWFQCTSVCMNLGITMIHRVSPKANKNSHANSPIPIRRTCDRPTRKPSWNVSYIHLKPLALGLYWFTLAIGLLGSSMRTLHLLMDAHVDFPDSFLSVLMNVKRIGANATKTSKTHEKTRGTMSITRTVIWKRKSTF